MSQNTNLDSGHYAAGWSIPKENQFNDLTVVNQAGIAYANAADGQEKQDALLQILKWFHGYLMKYVDMIVRGHLHTYQNNISRDSKALLKYFLPKGELPTSSSLSNAVRHLHLAFQGQSATEIYDILNILLLRAMKKYDPNYAEKVKIVVGIINKFPKKKLFITEKVAKKIPFEPTGQLRLLARNKFITSVKGPGKKLIGYKTKDWPPNAKFLSSGPIGFSYVVQMWFRYYLQDHINEQMKTLEARAWGKTVQLGHMVCAEDPDEAGFTNEDIPHAEGEVVDGQGHGWAADTSLMKKSFDISIMTPAWVIHTEDKLFKNMTRTERRILYLYYVQEASWKQIGTDLNMSVNQIQKIHVEVLAYLQSKFSSK